LGFKGSKPSQKGEEEWVKNEMAWRINKAKTDSK
jgi:hypothetical protein